MSQVCLNCVPMSSTELGETETSKNQRFDDRTLKPLIHRVISSFYNNTVGRPEA